MIKTIDFLRQLGATRFQQGLENDVHERGSRQVEI